MNDNDWNSVLIPMIRKVMPAIVAQDIVGVQPMSAINAEPIVVVEPNQPPGPPEGYLTVDVLGEVALWIEEQPIYMWKHGDIPAYAFGRERYTVSEQLYTWMRLKWS